MMEEILRQFAQTAALLCERNWAERNAGNISYRLEAVPEQMKAWVSSSITLPCEFPALAEMFILITAAGSPMRCLKEDVKRHIVGVEILKDGKKARVFTSPESNELQASSELLTHLYSHAALLERDKTQRSLVHAHVSPLIFLSHHPAVQDAESLNGILLRMHPETMYFLPEGAGFISFELPGSESIAQATSEGFKVHNLLIWERHGALACAPDMLEAFDRLDLAARAAEIFLECKSAGFTPKALSEKEILLLKKHYKLLP